MSRWTFILDRNSRAKVLRWVEKAPDGAVVEIREDTRTGAQNNLMWDLLTQVAAQHMKDRGSGEVALRVAMRSGKLALSVRPVKSGRDGKKGSG